VADGDDIGGVAAVNGARARGARPCGCQFSAASPRSWCPCCASMAGCD